MVATFFGAGWLALWRPGEVVKAAPALELAQPDGRRVRRLPIGGARVALGDVLAELVALPRDLPVTPSVAAWSIAAQTAVDLVARGRIRPARTATGGGGWSVGPLDLADRQRLADLAAGPAQRGIRRDRRQPRGSPGAGPGGGRAGVRGRRRRSPGPDRGGGAGGRRRVRKPGRPLGAGRGAGRLARRPGFRPRRRRHPRLAHHLAGWPRRTAGSRGAAAQSGGPQPGRRRHRTLVRPRGGARTPGRGRRGRPAARPAAPVDGVAAGCPAPAAAPPRGGGHHRRRGHGPPGPVGGRGELDRGRSALASGARCPGGTPAGGRGYAHPHPYPRPGPGRRRGSGLAGIGGHSPGGHH